jgi:hypothetical protein
MPVLRLQVAVGADTALPRDRFVLTPHFDVGFDIGNLDASPDAQALCDDLAEALRTFFVPARGREIEVKAYDAQGTKPVYPIGRAIRDQGLYPESPVMREVALCLSFYSSRNTKRQRGRLYVPAAAAFTGSSMPARPSEAHRIYVGTLAPILQNLGGTNVDWVVYSRVDDTARPVTNWFVDDEWDVQRRRGFRSTTRTVGTTSEAGIP